MLNTSEKNNNITMVCLIGNLECGRLISEGRKIADMTNTSLYVMDVQPKAEWGKIIRKELDYLFSTSKNLNAKMFIFFSDNPIEIINDYIERTRVKHVVLGNSEINGDDFIKQLNVKYKEIEIHICK